MNLPAITFTIAFLVCILLAFQSYHHADSGPQLAIWFFAAIACGLIAGCLWIYNVL